MPSHVTDPLLDLRRLRYFVSVARSGGFRQAAITLGMAQPPLSQQIMALEKQLGQRLFIRGARSIELTDAGRALLVDADSLLARAAEIPERLKRAANGRTGSLCLGFTPALAHHPIIPQILRGFAKEKAEVDLLFREDDGDLLGQGVAEGRISAAFLRSPVPMLDNLQVDRIAEEALFVVVQNSHHLADKRSISLKSLADEDFVMFERKLAPGLYDSIITACLAAGYSMKIVHHAPQKVSAILLAASGVGITIVPVSLVGVHAEAVKMIPIQGPQPVAEISLATRANESSVLPGQFRQFCLGARLIV